MLAELLAPIVPRVDFAREDCTVEYGGRRWSIMPATTAPIGVDGSVVISVPWHGGPYCGDSVGCRPYSYNELVPVLCAPLWLRCCALVLGQDDQDDRCCALVLDQAEPASDGFLLFSTHSC